MGNGVGLDTAFNQDPATQNINTHAKKDKTPDGLEKKSPKEFKGHAEQSSATRFRNFDDIASEDEREDAYRGTDYTMDKIGNAAQKTLNLERIQHAKIGETVSYNATTGTIVRKDGSYVTIYNEGNNAFDQIHAGQTSISTDTISSGITAQLWDQMRQEQRIESLSKANVEEPLHFISRKWSELPMNLKNILKFNPDSEPGKKMPGTASNKPEKQTMTPGGKNVLIGNTGNKLNTGQTRTTKPGNKVPVKVGGKTYMVTERQRETWHKNTTESQRGDKTFVTDYGNKLSGKKTGVKQDSTYKPGPKPAAKPAVGSNVGTTTGQTKGPGHDGKGSVNPATPTVTTKKPGGSAGAATNSVKPAGTKNLTGSTSTTTAGSTAAAAAARRSTSSPTPPRQSEGVTFATGLDKANNYSDLATAIYRIRNNINKVLASTPNATPFGKIPGTGKKPGDKPAVAPAGGTKFFSDTGKGPFNSQEEADASTPRQRRNISAERTARAEYNAKPGQTIANRLDENKSGKVDGKTDFSGLGGKEDPFDKKLICGSKKSDVEHGAYGGVVTDTEFDATEDYEEKRPKVQGKEFDHNHQQKTPRDPKEDGKEVMVGYHNKEGDGGAVTTGTPGANNPRYNPKYDPDEDGYKEKSFINKNNSRYGVRKASREDIERLTK